MVKRKKQASVVINNHNTVKVSNSKPRRRRAGKPSGAKKFNSLGVFGGGGGASFIPLVEQPKQQPDLNPVFHNLTLQSQQIAHLQQQQALLTHNMHYINDSEAPTSSNPRITYPESTRANSVFSTRASSPIAYRPTSESHFEGEEDTKPPPPPPRLPRRPKPDSFHTSLGPPVRLQAKASKVPSFLEQVREK